MLLVLGGSYLMWRRVKALKLDPKEYGNTHATTHVEDIQEIEVQ